MRIQILVALGLRGYTTLAAISHAGELVDDSKHNWLLQRLIIAAGELLSAAMRRQWKATVWPRGVAPGEVSDTDACKLVAARGRG
ncbi:MAG: hypothetical protein IPL79_16225 [Myxococcales bacterium]|nr:hypothetical protein [Myxococcales bacterium]